MKEKLINFETAKLAKEKGFDWEVSHSIATTISCKTELKQCSKSLSEFNFNDFGKDSSVKFYSRPTQSLLQKWLREVHKIDMYIEPVWTDYEKGITEYIPWVLYPKELDYLEDEEALEFTTYEEALEFALVKALELIKIKKRFYRVCNEDSLKMIVTRNLLKEK